MSKVVKVKRVFTHTYEMPVEYYTNSDPVKHELEMDAEEALELLYGGQGNFHMDTTVSILEKDED
jgi:hypothetical protein